MFNSQQRKQRPIHKGVLKYFPDALLEVAHTSWVGNEQHNPGTDLHWDRSKSGDELDACSRHILEAGTIDTDGVRHSAKVAWRALANLQKELERDGVAYMSEYNLSDNILRNTSSTILDRKFVRSEITKTSDAKESH